MDVRSLFATALSYTIEEPVGPCSARKGRSTSQATSSTINAQLLSPVRVFDYFNSATDTNRRSSGRRTSFLHIRIE